MSNYPEGAVMKDINEEKLARTMKNLRLKVRRKTGEKR